MEEKEVNFEVLSNILVATKCVLTYLQNILDLVGFNARLFTVLHWYLTRKNS